MGDHGYTMSANTIELLISERSGGLVLRTSDKAYPCEKEDRP